jgi:hypothetical protein
MTVTTRRSYSNDFGYVAQPRRSSELQQPFDDHAVASFAIELAVALADAEDTEFGRLGTSPNVRRDREAE